MWTNYVAPIFIRFNIPYTHALRDILVTVSGEQFCWPYNRPQFIFFVQNVVGRSLDETSGVNRLFSQC